MVAKRSARNERTQAINQARSLILTGPDDLRARFAGHAAAALAEAIAGLRPRPGDAAEYAVRVALRELGRRVEFLDAQLERLEASSSRSSPPARPACSASTASARTPRPCCSSPPGTTRSGCAARPPGRTCAGPPRSIRRPPRAPFPAFPHFAEPRDLIRACPPSGAALPCLVRPSADTKLAGLPAKEGLDNA